jgi:hypothetical protein
MKEFWNERYSEEAFAYGEAPNLYFRQKLDECPSTGRLLLPAEGQGRNGVYAAQLGWQVTAFDLSEVAQQKAKAFATSKGVALDYLVGNVADLTFPDAAFDAMALIYAHFPSSYRRTWHRRLSQTLKPGAFLILEAFSKVHLRYIEQNPKVGGPKDANLLYDLAELKDDFTGFEFIEALQTEVTLDEGLYHQGKGSVIRMLARKS